MGIWLGLQAKTVSLTIFGQNNIPGFGFCTASKCSGTHYGLRESIWCNGERERKARDRAGLVCLHAVSSSDEDLDAIFRELGFSTQTVGDAYLEISACSKSHMKKQFVNSCQRGTNVAPNLRCQLETRRTERIGSFAPHNTVPLLKHLSLSLLLSILIAKVFSLKWVAI